MSTTSVQLLLTLQALDDNPDTWGDVLNVSTIELLEDAIAGMATATLTSGDYTLDTTAGGDASGDDHYRKMIVKVDGTPGAPTNVIVPDKTKVYLIWNATGDGTVVTVKTLSGAGIAIPDGDTYWVYCDAVDVIGGGSATAGNATLAATATNALSLGGILAADYGPLDVSNVWTAGQTVQRVVLTDPGVTGDITPDLSESNSFFHLIGENAAGINLKAPVGATNGSQFSIVVEQDTGGPWSLTFQTTTYLFAGGTLPTLSAGTGDKDYLAFEYCTDMTGTAKWIGTIIKDVQAV